MYIQLHNTSCHFMLSLHDTHTHFEFLIHISHSLLKKMHAKIEVNLLHNEQGMHFFFKGMMSQVCFLCTPGATHVWSGQNISC